MTATEDRFDDRLAQWQEWCAAPWGRLRFSVVRDTLRRQVEALGGGPLRVLDVGGGDGRDAVPLAEAGHEVTVVDDALKHDPAYFAALERLELALCDREPYVRMGGMWQVVAEKRV